VSETQAGSIIGTLRLNIVDFEAGIAKAQELANNLERKSPNVKVTADTAGAEAKLAAVAASEDKVSRSSGGASSGLTSVESAARRVADASGVANVAQLRLSELQDSGKAKASQLAKASNDVERAQRTLADATWGTYASNIKLDESSKKVDDSSKKVDESNKKVAKSSKDASKGTSALAMAIVGLGPAIVPLAAATTGLAVGFGAMGAAGVLAIVGISKEIKAGTPLGASYTTMLGTLEGDLTTLSHTAAAGVLAPFQKEVATLQGQMPALNGIIGEFSVITGKTAGVLTAGLVAAFIALEPLARDAGVYVLDLSTRFAALMSGPGVVTFGDYIRSVFPQVMAAVESIVGAALHLVAALAPLGLGTLGILRTFTDLINAIPVDVLATLATTAVSVYLGFKTFGLLSGGITAVGAALQRVGVSAETAAVGMRALNIAAGAIGILITAATLIFAANAEATRANTQAANDYADALRASNGVIDESIRAMAVKNLSDSGALAAANRLGISLPLVTDAALGNADAIAKVAAATKPFTDAITVSTHAVGANSKATTENGLAAYKVATATGVQDTALKAGIQTWKDQKAATASSTDATKAADAAQKALAAKVGTTAAALVLATAGQKTTADAAAQAAAKMYLENDAAGILKNSLDLLNGKTLNAAQAQNSFDSSLVNMGDHVNATGKKITFTTTSIGNMSSASVALRGQLNGQVTNLQAVVEANGGLADSTGKARAQMVTMRQQIIDNAVAHGVNRAAVTAYVDKLLAIPKKIPPTKLDVDKAAADKNIADMQKRIDRIKQGKAPGLTANSTDGRAVVAALQTGIDRIKQGKPPGVTADITPGHAQIVLYQKQIDAIKQKLATGLDANPRAARLQITDLQAKIDAIKQHRVPPVTASTASGVQKIISLQAEIDRLHGKTITIFTQSVTKAGQSPTPMHHATGGTVVGSGTGTSDSVPIMASDGEEIINAKQSAKYRSLLKSINAGVDGFATGGTVRAAFAGTGPATRLASPAGYDTGGMMMPGGVGKNYGAKAERWLSGSQTEWFEAGRAAAGGGSGGAGMSGAIDYDRLASAMARVRIDLDGRNVARSVDRRLGMALA